MTNGFDVYNCTRTSPTRSFHVPTARKFIKKGVFGEAGNIIVGGSDHGKVYVFGINKSGPIQVLHHGRKGAMIQIVEVSPVLLLVIQTIDSRTPQTATSGDHHYIFSGASEGRRNIKIWRKNVSCRNFR